MKNSDVFTAGAFRPMQVSDAGWAAAQHELLMENSVFALFGERFLEKVYNCFALSKHSIAFIYEEGGAPQAVIASTSNRRAFLRELFFRSGFRMAALSVAAVFRNDACRRMLLRMPVYLKKTCKGAFGAEMIFITVARSCRKAGIARELIQMTLDEFKRRRVVDVNVSIESENIVIRDLLLSFGFEISDHFMFADKPNDLLTVSLGDDR